MKLALCQLNPVMGDIAGNTGRLIDTLAALAPRNPDLCIFPELFLQGYPPRDLLERRWFIANGLAALERIRAVSRQFPDMGILTGVAVPAENPGGKGLFNSAVLIADGAVLFRQHKSLLPDYDVFDETRYFDPAPATGVVRFKDETLGITVCEDAWNAPGMWERPRYREDPIRRLAEAGATLLVNISASPFYLGKQRLRFQLMADHARRHGVPLAFVNQTGGNDELIFDGSSMLVDAGGNLRAMLPSFGEEVRVVDTRDPRDTPVAPDFDSVAMVHDALVMGIVDYMRKCGFRKAVLGLSGGIDSAVTAALAAAALGPDMVTGVTMPSRYSSEGSVFDARELAANLGIHFKTIPIEPMFAPFLSGLTPHFDGRPADIAEENLQARIRGTILMALSNKFGCLLLSTGNKSEMAVGYCTLYGDMNGGLSVISDLPKTMVYTLARHINRQREIIPSASIAKPPSAELRPDQKDSDSLPSYDTLDAILGLLIEEGASIAEAADKGFDRQTVGWVAEAIRKSEYKRRQAAPGLKVTPKAFGVGRRFPIAAKYER
jgi:NAD+ synthase (glutamine-hydrolysing)